MKCLIARRWGPMAVVTLGLSLWSPEMGRAERIVGFEGLTFSPGKPYEDGAGLSGGFEAGGLLFNNSFTDWGGGVTSWDGWAYSKAADMTTPGFENQFSAYSQSYRDGTSGPGAGSGGSEAYGVAFVSEFGLLAGDPPPTLELPPGEYVKSATITNTTYAYLVMKEGDDGNDPPFVEGPFATGDFFKLTVTGLDAAGGPVGSVDYYLADFRPADQRPDNGVKTDYILDDWTALEDLQPLDGSGAVTGISELVGARSLEFRLDSSDRLPAEQGGWANTPLYFAMDDIVVAPIPEPSAVAMIVAAALCGGLWRRRRRGL